MTNTTERDYPPTIPYHEAFPNDLKYTVYYMSKHPEYVPPERYRHLNALQDIQPFDEGAEDVVFVKEMQSRLGKIYWTRHKFVHADEITPEMIDKMEEECTSAIQFCLERYPKSHRLCVIYLQYAKFLCMIGKYASAKFVAETGLKCNFPVGSKSKAALINIINNT